jgi:predicted aldo/keto reductase-like oxidoreductase
MIMEPLLGGILATGLPQQAVEMFKKNDPNLTPADLALWWLWNQSEVTVVFSGMYNTKILEYNLRSTENFRSLTENELEVYSKVIGVFRKSYKIKCTSCNYCLPCPKGINIPACFSAYNTSFMQGFFRGVLLHITSTAAITKNPKSPRLCNHCGKCEKICPQNLPIRQDLIKVAKRFEPIPIRFIVAGMRSLVTR